MLRQIFELADVPPSYLLKAAADPTFPAMPTEGLPGILPYIAGIMSLITLAAALLSWYRATKPEKPKSLPISPDLSQADIATAIYYTGPLKAIFDLLTEIKGRQALNRLELKDDFAAMLSDQRRQLADVIERVGPNVGNQMTAAEHRVTENINSVHGRIDDVNSNLVEITTKIDHLPKRR